MKTLLKVAIVLFVAVVGYYFIQSENYKREMEANNIRIQNEIDRQNNIYSLDSAARARRNAIELAELNVKLQK